MSAALMLYSFNRTTLELKFRDMLAINRFELPFNRTTLELKWRYNVGR